MYTNVSGTTDVGLTKPGENFSDIKTIHITNTHVSAEVLVDLYIGTLSSDGVAAVSYYLIKGHKIEKGNYINLESDILSFRNTSSIGYGLFISLNNADSTVDVLMKQ